VKVLYSYSGDSSDRSTL